MSHMIAVLLSWTVNLSSYPHPGTQPVIEYRPHSFFVEKACFGSEKCRVGGWYDNNGTIYLDERTRNNDDPMTRSLIVHELTHYLQDLSGKFDLDDCDDYLVREREAYSVQRQYLNRIANVYAAVYMNFPPCPGS